MNPSLAIVPVLFLCASSLLAAPQALAGPKKPVQPGNLLVSGYDSNKVHRYRVPGGAPQGHVGATGAQSIVLGSDGLLYVCAEKVDRVVRMDPQTWTWVDAFVRDDPQTPADENGPLNGPTAAVFGPNGALYVASFENDRILRFNGLSGAYEGVFVPAGSGGLDGPDAGTKFGSDGLLYVPSFWNDRVLRYDAQGNFVDEFVSFREGTCRQPRDLVEHGGDWYVASSANNRVLRFDAQGNSLGIFATVLQPYSLAFNSRDDHLYVVSLQTNSVKVHDGESGDYLKDIVPNGGGGIASAVYLFFLD
jgi:DNA-binding beta-propeller fold protein YncE